jgi:hypothetical protein
MEMRHFFNIPMNFGQISQFKNWVVVISWSLEKELVNESRILFEHEPQNAFFHPLKQGSFDY